MKRVNVDNNRVNYSGQSGQPTEGFGRISAANRLPGRTDSAVPQDVEPRPIKPQPVAPKQVEPEPVELKQVESESIDPKQVEPETVESTPIEPVPVKEEPVKSEPIKEEPRNTRYSGSTISTAHREILYPDPHIKPEENHSASRAVQDDRVASHNERPEYKRPTPYARPQDNRYSGHSGHRHTPYNKDSDEPRYGSSYNTYNYGASSRSKNGSSMKIIIAIAVAIIVVLGGGIFGFKHFKKKEAYKIANQYMLNGQYNEAKSAYTAIVSKYRDTDAIMKAKEAEDLYQSSLNYAEGERLADAGNYEDAKIKLKQVIAEDKNYSYAQALLAQIDAKESTATTKTSTDSDSDKDAPSSGGPISWDNASASSFLVERDFVHDPRKVLDSNQSTNWTESVSGPGIGEWIKLENTHKNTIKSIAIFGGNNKSTYWWRSNNRVKRAKIDLSTGQSYTVDLPDEYRATNELILPKPVAVNWVKITIEDVYKGSKWDDTVISEVKFN